MAKAKPLYPAIGVDGLPPAAGLMQAGGAYALECRQSWIQAAVICGMVARALLDRRPVTLVIGTMAGEVLSRLPAHGIDAAAEQSRRRLCVLELQEQTSALLLRHGTERFLDEMEYFSDPRGRLVIIVPADHLMSGADRQLGSQQAEAYARWCREQAATAAFVFIGSDGSSTAPQLMALDGWFAGVARINGDGLHLSWDIEHWRSPEGSVGNRSYGIGMAHNHAMLLATGAQLATRDQRIIEAPDYHQVLAVAMAVRHEKSRPPAWKMVNSHQELLGYASSAVAATFILDCGPQQNIEELTHTVHHLRIHAGNGIKIIVRARGRHLRYSQEILLLRLGANSVADTSLSFSRLLSLIDSLRDRSFDRTVPPIFEQAVLAAVPPEHTGYLPPAMFAGEVREAVGRAAVLGVQCALVRLVINPQLAHLDVLHKVHASRPGDLFSADDRSLLIFLFACREPDIDTALARIIGPAQTELFDAQVHHVDQDSINATLTAFERQLRITPAVDYSSLLERRQPKAGAIAADATESALAPVFPRAYPVLDMPVAPARSVNPAPLNLRTPA